MIPFSQCLPPSPSSPVPLLVVSLFPTQLAAIFHVLCTHTHVIWCINAKSGVHTWAKAGVCLPENYTDLQLHPFSCTMAQFHSSLWLRQESHCASIYRTFFLHSSVVGHASGFHDLAIVTRAAGNIDGQRPLWYVDLKPWARSPWVGELDYVGVLLRLFFGEPPCWSPQWLASSHSHQWWKCFSLVCIPLGICCCFPNDCHSDWAKRATLEDSPYPIPS